MKQFKDYLKTVNETADFEGFTAYRIPNHKRDEYLDFVDKLQTAAPTQFADSNWDVYSGPIIQFDISVFSQQNNKAIISFMLRIDAKNVTAAYLTNESGELVPVMGTDIVKLQKPATDTFANIVVNNDGIEIADCTVCGATGVLVNEHICKTVIDPNSQVSSEFKMTENTTSVTSYSSVPVTNVRFLVNEKDCGDVFAYFQEENQDGSGRFKTCYSHIGQHSNCTDAYVTASRNATIEEYKSLAQEMESIGYNIHILNNNDNDVVVESRFKNIRSKYGVNESKMITKIDWFKSAILESPDNTKSESDSVSELSLNDEELETETKRLFSRYNNAEASDNIRNMFPEYQTTEAEDATYMILDKIYDNESITDAIWKALKPRLFAIFKSHIEQMPNE